MRETAVDREKTKGKQENGPGIPKIPDPSRRSAILPPRIDPYGSVGGPGRDPARFIWRPS